MKKVVLLSGVIAAGLAAAPVVANAAAPTAPGIQEVADADDVLADYHYIHGVIDGLDAQLKAIDLNVQNTTFVNTEAETEAKAIIQDLKKEFKDAADPIEVAHQKYLNAKIAMNPAEEAAAITELETAIANAAGYNTADEKSAIVAAGKQAYPDDEFLNALPDMILALDKEWSLFKDARDNKWKPLSVESAMYFLSNADYKEVNEITEVGAAKTTFGTALNDYRVAYEGLHAARKTYAKVADVEAAYAAINEGETAELTFANNDWTAVQELVSAYQTDKAELKGLYDTAKSAVDGVKVDPTTDAAFLNSDGNYSVDYATAINAKWAEIENATDDALDYIETFNAADPATWRTTKAGEDATLVQDERAAGSYYATALAKINTTIAALQSDYEALVAAAKENVKAYNQLIAAEATRQGEMDALRDAETTDVNGATVTYWNKKKEDTTYSDDATIVKEGTTPLYQSFIQDLQKGLDDEEAGYGTMTVTDTDIHSQILKYFEPVTELGATLDNDHDACKYLAENKTGEDVFKTLKDNIATLQQNIDENEAANKTLHTAYDAKLEEHVNEMYNACVAYEDVTTYDFTFAVGKYFSDGTCEHGSSYLGYRNLWRHDKGVRGFVKAEVAAYNAFDNAGKGSKAFLESTEDTGANKMKQAVDDYIELLWNHVATDQIEEYMKDVDTKMKAKYADAEALDPVCNDEPTVFSWTDDKVGVCACDEADKKPAAEGGNPCGWCDATAKGEFKQIRDDYNQWGADLDTWHKAIDAKNHVADAKTYKEATADADGAIDKWLADFTTADTAHKAKLKETKDLTDASIHKGIHEAVAQAEFELNNFDEGDKAVADKWAKALTGLDLDLDGVEDTFTDFEDFVQKLEAAEPIYTAKAQDLYDHHHWNQLNDLYESIKALQVADNYKKEVQANRDAATKLREGLAAAQATLDAAKNAVDENKVYADDYADLTTIPADPDNSELKTAQAELDKEAADIEAAYKAGEATTYVTANDVKGAIDTYVQAVKAAEKEYSDNLAAKTKLEERQQNVISLINATLADANCAVTEGCDAEIAKDLETLQKKAEDVLPEIDAAFKAKQTAKDATDSQYTTIDEELEGYEKEIATIANKVSDFLNKVNESNTAAKDATKLVERAFDGTNGLIAKAEALEGAGCFDSEDTGHNTVTDKDDVRNSDPKVKYFDEIKAEVQALKDEIAKDNSHEGGHSAFDNYYDYMDKIDAIKEDIKILEKAIEANELAYGKQKDAFDELYAQYGEYDCYDTAGVKAAAEAILGTPDREHPTVLDGTVKHLLDVYTALIEQRHDNGASVQCESEINTAKGAWTSAYESAQSNDQTFVALYNNGTRLKAEGLAQNWQAEDHQIYENGANKWSDTADTNVTAAYNTVLEKIQNFLNQIEQDWYNGVAADQAAANAYQSLIQAVTDAVTAHGQAVSDATTNDTEFLGQKSALDTANGKTLTGIAAVSADVESDTHYAALKLQAEDVKTNRIDGKDTALLASIVAEWEAETSAAKAFTDAIADYDEAKDEYNALVANLNKLGEQLQTYFDKDSALAAVESEIAGYDVMKSGLKTLPDGETQDYAAKATIEGAEQDAEDAIHDLYDKITDGADAVAKTITDDNDNTAVNEVEIADDVQDIQDAIDALESSAADAEDACDANEAAKTALHADLVAAIATVAKSDDLVDPVKEAYETEMIGKDYANKLEGYHTAFDEAYYAETAAEYQEENQDEIAEKEAAVDYAHKLAKELSDNGGFGDVDGYDVDADVYTPNGITVKDSDALVDIYLYGRDYNKYGDLDFDGENTETDIERLNNLMWYKTVVPGNHDEWKDYYTKAPGHVSFEASVELTAEGNTIALALNNNCDTRAMSFEISVPEGATLSNVLGTERTNGMRILSARVDDTTYRVLVLSTAKANGISDNEGNIITFNVSGDGEVEVYNVHATDRNVIGHSLSGAAINISNPTAIDEIAAEGDISIFGLDGIRKNVMQSGVNIVRSANGAVKKIFKK